MLQDGLRGVAAFILHVIDHPRAVMAAMNAGGEPSRHAPRRLHRLDQRVDEELLLLGCRGEHIDMRNDTGSGGNYGHWSSVDGAVLSGSAPRRCAASDGPMARSCNSSR